MKEKQQNGFATFLIFSGFTVHEAQEYRNSFRQLSVGIT